MKLLALFILGCAALPLSGAELFFEGYLEPFDATRCQVIWPAEVKKLPAKIKLLEVLPSRFTAGTISNVLHLAELTPRQKKRPIQTGVFLDKDVLCYGDTNEDCTVVIAPSQGLIVIARQPASPPRGRVPVGVPGHKEAIRRALAILPMLGLSASDVVRSDDGDAIPGQLTETEDMYRDKATGTLVTNVLQREVRLTRKIDGIPIWGLGGLSMKYGEHGRVYGLELVWRTVKPLKEISVPVPSVLMEQIKAGQGLLRPTDKWPVKRLVIKKAQLYYWEREGSVRQSTINPFMVLTAETDLPGKRRTLDLFLQLVPD